MMFTNSISVFAPYLFRSSEEVGQYKKVHYNVVLKLKCCFDGDDHDFQMHVINDAF